MIGNPRLILSSATQLMNIAIKFQPRVLSQLKEGRIFLIKNFLGVQATNKTAKNTEV
jgi:hypothetical protein